MEVYITTKIDEPQKVQNRVDAIPEPPSMPADLKTYSRPLWIVIKNRTQFHINPVGTPYFYTGSLHGESLAVQPYSVTAFGASNNHWWTGCTGGAAFRLDLDPKTVFNFVIGFTNPVLGAYHAHVEESTDAEKDGYKKAGENGNSIVSKNIYRGVSKNQGPLSAKFHLSISAGQTMTVTISQNVFEPK